MKVIKLFISTILVSFFVVSCKKKYWLNYDDPSSSRFQYLNLKTTTFIVGPRFQEKVYLDIRADKNNLIWISVKGKFGIELYRFLFDRDSVKFIDQLGQKYFITDYRSFSEFLGFYVDFDLAQKIILGYTKAAEESVLNREVQEKKNFIYVKKEVGNFVLVTKYLGASEIREISIFDIKKSKKAHFYYFYKAEVKGPYHLLNLFMTLSGNKLKIKNKLKKAITLRKRPNFNFEVPSHYTVIKVP